MLRVISVRIAIGIATVLAAATVVFFGTELLPVDTAEAVLGDQATPELLEQFRKDYGLDKPVVERYWIWLSGAVQGDLGRSVPSNDPVTLLIGDRLKNTATLALLTLLVMVPISLFFGIVSALLHNRATDHAITGVALWLMAVPDFVVGFLLAIALGVWLGVLPPVSLIDPEVPLFKQLDAFVLPLVTLVTIVAAQSIRMIRACMIDALESEYVLLARLKGVPEWRVLVRHALPNALGPSIQILAMQAAWLAGGVVVVETVFQFPGVGMAMADAVQFRDLATVQAIALIITAAYILLNLGADVAVTLMNPRTRRQ